MTRRNLQHSCPCMALALGAGLFFPISLVATPHQDTHPLEAIFNSAVPAVVKLYGPSAGREHSYGTGVIVSPDGRILTSLSLLVSTDNIEVVLSDGRQFNGRLVRSDEQRQLALLKIEGTDLPFLSPHDTDHLKIGDSVFALGNWFKIAEGHETVSMNQGILSLYGPVETRRLSQQSDYAGPVLVFDAITANPGAAGGPLLDIEGNLVGLVGKIVEAENTYTRINFALPAEELRAFLGGEAASHPAISGTSTTSAKKGGKPYVGIKLAKLGYRHVSAFVDRVHSGSPADKAGIKSDDLVLAIDGRRVSSAEGYEELVRELIPGQTVPFTIKRGAQLLTLNVSIGTEP